MRPSADGVEKFPITSNARDAHHVDTLRPLSDATIGERRPLEGELLVPAE